MVIIDDKHIANYTAEEAEDRARMEQYISDHNGTLSDEDARYIVSGADFIPQLLVKLNSLSFISNAYESQGKILIELTDILR